MATNSLSKLLKKKKLTGQEVGKIILLDLVNSYTGQPELTTAERDSYTNAITQSQDVKDYNDYLQIYRFITGMVIDYESTERAFAVAVLQYLINLKKLRSAEDKYESLALQPRILTRRDYEKALQEGRQQVEQFTYSLFSLAKYEIEKTLKTYNAGEPTTYNHLFNEYKDKQASDSAISTYRAMYWQSKKNPKPDNELTLLAMLEKYIYIYDDHERGKDDKGGMLDFRRDYPELLQAIIDKYSQLEGLEYLASLADEDYLKDDLIAFKTAYELNILGAKDSYNDPLLTFRGYDLNQGVAVIESARAIAKGRIKNGTFYYYLGEGITRHLAEDVLADSEHIASIEQKKILLKQMASSLTGFKYFMQKLADITGVPELTAFVRPDKTNKLIYLQNLAEDFYIQRSGLLEDEGNPAEICPQVRSLYSLGFTPDDIQVTAEEEAELEEIIEHASSREKAVINAFNYLVARG